MINYKKRIKDDLLDLKLESFGTALIVDPRGYGKTTTTKKSKLTWLKWKKYFKNHAELNYLCKYL